MIDSRENYRSHIQKAHWGTHALRTPESTAAFFLPYVRQGMRLLDVGCGTGSITQGFVRYVAEGGGSVVGVDVNSEAIDFANSRFSGEGISFVEANLYHLPFFENSADAIFCHGVLIHMRDPVSALREMYRILSPGGIVGLSAVDHDSMIIYPKNIWLEKSIRLYERLWRLGSGWGEDSKEGSDLYLGKKLRELSVKSGFKTAIASARAVYEGDSLSTKRAAEQEIEHLKAEQLKQYVIDYKVATEAEIEKMIDSWHMWGEDESVSGKTCL